MDNKALRRINFRILKSRAGSKAALARATGVNQAYMSQFDPERPKNPNQKPKNPRDIGDDVARKLETYPGTGYGWMDTDHSRGSVANTVGDASIRRVTLITWDQAGRLGEKMDSIAFDEDAEVVYTDASIGQGAFALRVQGDSMVNSEGTPSFPDGCIIVIDPSVIAMPGDHVVVRLPAVEEAVFKKLELFDGKRHLKPLNRQYPIAEMPGGAQILGVVVSVQKNEAIVPRSRR